MRTLILSDIHANEPALSAVLEDAGKCDRIIFLGDLANFGPHPAECVDLLMKYNPICIMGNHDELIVNTPEHFWDEWSWDEWSKRKLNENQQSWIRHFKDSYVLDGHILLLHGAYAVDYDILPTTPDYKIEQAFAKYLTPQIDEIWFGHYHYQIDKTINGITYRCIRPVGHHRDRDTRAGYSIYENDTITHHRVKYDLDQTIADFLASDAFENYELKLEFAELLRNAYHEKLLVKDIEQMKRDVRTTE